MTMEQVVTSNLSVWPLEGTPTRSLSEDFSTMVFGVDDLRETRRSNVCLLVSLLTPSRPKAFKWEAAERRADGEMSHGRFAEFNDVKDLLSDLHE